MYKSHLLYSLSLNLITAVLVAIALAPVCYGNPVKAISTRLNTKSKLLKHGDPFSVTIVPKEKSFVFLFYIDDKDKAVSIYPGKEVNFRIISKEDPLVISRLTDNLIKIDKNKGKLITVAVQDSVSGKKVRTKVLNQSSDFSNGKPYKHMLSLSGKQLIERLEYLKADHPKELHFLVEDAPLAMPAK